MRRWALPLAALLLLTACSSTPAASSTSTNSATSTTGATSGPSATGTAGTRTTFTNPVLGQGADPFVTVVHGRYYYVQSAADGKGVSLQSSTSLALLQYAPTTSLFEAHGSAPCCEYWAPEVHQIGKAWYVYVAADDGNNNHHRTYVLKSSKITGPYTFAGELKLPDDRWAIDSTILPEGHGVYDVIWAGWPGGTNGEQDIYIARLASPTTTTGPRVRLSRPQYGWEKHAGDVGVRVNEGPAVLRHGSKVYVTYSASGCWTPDYALGMLTADASSNLLSAASWHKSAMPVFHGGAASGEYGTGHNGFFTSPDGTQTWLVYHAVTDSGGSCGDDRQVYAQPITFAANGTPQLGTPSGTDKQIPLPAGDPGR